MNLFFVDAETDGLYGAFLSVAVLVTDAEGHELDHFYGAVSPDKTAVTSEWVKENVVPYLDSAEVFFRSENDLMEAFWQVWMRWREEADCVADVCYPVEARLFNRCVMADPEARCFLGPYPLLDLSTLLAARGIDPHADRHALSGLKLVQHDALNDVRIASAIWHRLIDRREDFPCSCT